MKEIIEEVERQFNPQEVAEELWKAVRELVPDLPGMSLLSDTHLEKLLQAADLSKQSTLIALNVAMEILEGE